MATYYAPRRPSISTASSRSILLEGSSDDFGYGAELQLAQLDQLTSAAQSIYVFPNPSSAPPSPAVPLPPHGDLGSPFRPRPRLGSQRPSRLLHEGSAASSGDRTDPLSEPDSFFEEDADAFSWTSPSFPSSAVQTPSSPSASFDFLEAELTRAPPWPESHRAVQSVLVLQERTNRAFAHMNSVAPPARITLDYAQRLNPLRARTQSLLSYVSLSSKTSGGKEALREPSPKSRLSPPQIVPFLTFFAHMLALDRDDPVLRALEHPEAEDDFALFPGYAHNSPDHSAENDDLQDGAEGYTFFFVPGQEPVLARLLAADLEVSALRTLRKSLASPLSLNLEFDFGSKPLLRLWQVLGDGWGQIPWRRSS